jgi:hypothetical protein
MGNTQHDHAAFDTQTIQESQQMTPVRQSMRVAFGVATIDLFNAADMVLSAQVIPDQSFQPIERIDHDRLIFMRLTDQRVEISDSVCKHSPLAVSQILAV